MIMFQCPLHYEPKKKLSVSLTIRMIVAKNKEVAESADNAL